MSKLKVELLLICLNILGNIYFGKVKGDCVMKYPNDAEIAPIYSKVIGKYVVEIPFTGNELRLNDGEVINGLCKTNFTSISYNVETRDRYNYARNTLMTLKNQTFITLHCRKDNLYTNNSMLMEKHLECAKLKWSIYDAQKSYDWCNNNQNSNTFLLATKSNDDHHILAVICYNLDDWSLQTITYNATYAPYQNHVEILRDVTKTELKSFQPLGEDLWSLKTTKTLALTGEDLQKQIMELSKINSWLYLASYETSSIVQSNSYENYFNEYLNILEIIWWRNLRLGNWKLFMNTLENYAYGNKFQLYTGSSGAVMVPVNDARDKINILEIKNGFKNQTIPAYIWTYLKSNDNLNEDFIIVGYNSPYAEFFDLKNIVFCPDICTDIPWLKEIHPPFRFSTAGVMFCCSPKFIRQTNFLQGFPMDVLESRLALENTTEKEIDQLTDNKNIVEIVEANCETNQTEAATTIESNTESG